MIFKRKLFYLIYFLTIIVITIFVIELSLIFVTKSGYEDQTNMSFKYKKLKEEYLINDPNSDFKFYIVVDYKYFIDNNKNEEISYYPLSNISNSKTVFCKENNHFKSIKSDKFGFNNTNNIYDLKSHDIAIIGDSFGFGSCVNREDNVAANLNKLNLNTINFSTSGNGLLSNYAIFREYVIKIKPKKVLLFWYEGNDFHNTQDEYESINLRKYLEDKKYSQNLLDKQNLTDSKLNNFYNDSLNKENFIINRYKFNFINFLKLNNFTNLIKNKKIIIPNPYLSRKYKKNEFYNNLISEILVNFKNEINDWGGELYVIYLPDYWRYEYINDNLISHNRMKIYKEKKNNFINILKNNDLIFFDFEQILSSQSNPINFFDKQSDPHYSVEGYKLLSNSIYKFLIDL